MLTCEIYDYRKNKHSFSVMLNPVRGFPKFPSNSKISPIVRFPLSSVVAAQFDDEGWSFCCLSADEKHCIGDEMIKEGVKMGEWYWCNLYKHNRHGEG